MKKGGLLNKKNWAVYKQKYSHNQSLENALPDIRHGELSGGVSMVVDFLWSGVTITVLARVDPAVSDIGSLDLRSWDLRSACLNSE